MYYTKKNPEWLYGYRVVVSVLVVDPRDCMADGEVSLAAAAQRHKRVSDHISLAHEKIKIQSMNLLNAYHFCTTVKSNNLK